VRGLLVLLSAVAGLAFVSRPATAASEYEYLIGDTGWVEIQPDARTPSLQLQFEPRLGYWNALPSAGPALAPPVGATPRPGGVGVGLELPVGESFSFTPSIVAGRQPTNDASSPGMALELRGGAELSYDFGNDLRLGAAWFHMTEGGMSSSETGSDLFTFSFTVPLGR
jgi:hypothetical protein